VTRHLLPDVVVLEGTDVEGAWERFEVFEELHHGMRICNPMLDADLDAVADHLNPAPGDGMLDVACGYGELLIRSAERTPIRGVGLDLSPWILVGAVAEAQRRVPDGDLQWSLGDGKALPPEPWDVLACLGASWIWNGFAGTCRAVAARTRPGASIAIGDLVLKPNADADGFAEDHGKMLSLTEQHVLLRNDGFDHLDRLVVPDTSFEAYDQRVAASAQEWAVLHPGPRAEEYLAEQRRWAEDHRRDRQFLTWVVWLGRRSA